MVMTMVTTIMVMTIMVMTIMTMVMGMTLSGFPHDDVQSASRSFIKHNYVDGRRAERIWSRGPYLLCAAVCCAALIRSVLLVVVAAAAV